MPGKIFSVIVILGLSMLAGSCNVNKSHTYHTDVSSDSYKGRKVKDGQYHWSGEAGLVTGRYKNGEKVDIWRFANKKDSIAFAYDYSRDSLLTSEVNNEELDKSEIYLDGKWRSDIKGFIAPQYMLGMDQFYQTSLKYMEYPETARRQKEAGVVVVQIQISKKGKLSALKIEDGISAQLNENVLRMVRSMPDLWVPAKYQGKPVKSRYFMPISYRLD